MRFQWSDLGYGKQAGALDSLVTRLLTLPVSDRLRLVGGVATRFHLCVGGGSVDSRAFNDLDIIATSEDAITLATVPEFEVHHWHPADGYAAYVDAATGIKIDLFAPRVDVEGNELWGGMVCPSIGVNSVPIIDASMATAVLVVDCRKIVIDKAIDPKQIADLMSMTSIADHVEVGRIYRAITSRGVMADLAELTWHALRAERQGLVGDKALRGRVSSPCVECEPIGDESGPDQEMPFTYFVSYAHGHGFGSMEVHRSHPLETFEQVKSMNTLIEERGLLSPTVLGFKLLRGPCRKGRP